MRRNLLLFLAVIIGIILVVNYSKRILSLRTTSQKVAEADAQLEKLKSENEALKRELEYKKSEKFAEEEIRNKLGLVKEGETIVILPGEKEEPESSLSQKQHISNWQKWKNLFFGS